jgi:hypothetical protein
MNIIAEAKAQRAEDPMSVEEMLADGRQARCRPKLVRGSRSKKGGQF